MDEIEVSTFTENQTELRSQESRLQVQLDASSRQLSEWDDLAVKVFELSQILADKWVTADIEEIRLLLEIVCLNFSLEGECLCIEARKPFDLLAEGPPVLLSRGDWI